jgi:hypothetical protein
MDKRLEKRHKRQVARAREHKKLSEPDVRTPEQIKAAREASRALGAERHAPPPHLETPPEENTTPVEQTAPEAEA